MIGWARLAVRTTLNVQRQPFLGEDVHPVTFAECSTPNWEVRLCADDICNLIVAHADASDGSD